MDAFLRKRPRKRPRSALDEDARKNVSGKIGESAESFGAVDDAYDVSPYERFLLCEVALLVRTGAALGAGHEAADRGPAPRISLVPMVGSLSDSSCGATLRRSLEELCTTHHRVLSTLYSSTRSVLPGYLEDLTLELLQLFEVDSSAVRQPRAAGDHGAEKAPAHSGFSLVVRVRVLSELVGQPFWSLLRRALRSFKSKFLELTHGDAAERSWSRFVWRVLVEWAELDRFTIDTADATATPERIEGPDLDVDHGGWAILREDLEAGANHWSEECVHILQKIEYLSGQWGWSPTMVACTLQFLKVHHGLRRETSIAAFAARGPAGCKKTACDRTLELVRDASERMKACRRKQTQMIALGNGAIDGLLEGGADDQLVQHCVDAQLYMADCFSDAAHLIFRLRKLLPYDDNTADSDDANFRRYISALCWRARALQGQRRDFATICAELRAALQARADRLLRVYRWYSESVESCLRGSAPRAVVHGRDDTAAAGDREGTRGRLNECDRELADALRQASELALRGACDDAGEIQSLTALSGLAVGDITALTHVSKLESPAAAFEFCAALIWYAGGQQRPDRLAAHDQDIDEWLFSHVDPDVLVHKARLVRGMRACWELPLLRAVNILFNPSLEEARPRCEAATTAGRTLARLLTLGREIDGNAAGLLASVAKLKIFKIGRPGDSPLANAAVFGTRQGRVVACNLMSQLVTDLGDHLAAFPQLVHAVQSTWLFLQLPYRDGFSSISLLASGCRPHALGDQLPASLLGGMIDAMRRVDALRPLLPPVVSASAPHDGTLVAQARSLAAISEWFFSQERVNAWSPEIEAMCGGVQDYCRLVLGLGPCSEEDFSAFRLWRLPRTEDDEIWCYLRCFLTLMRQSLVASSRCRTSPADPRGLVPIWVGQLPRTLPNFPPGDVFGYARIPIETDRNVLATDLLLQFLAALAQIPGDGCTPLISRLQASVSRLWDTRCLSKSQVSQLVRFLFRPRDVDVESGVHSIEGPGAQETPEVQLDQLREWFVSEVIFPRLVRRGHGFVNSAAFICAAWTPRTVDSHPEVLRRLSPRLLEITLTNLVAHMPRRYRSPHHILDPRLFARGHLAVFFEVAERLILLFGCGGDHDSSMEAFVLAVAYRGLYELNWRLRASPPGGVHPALLAELKAWADEQQIAKRLWAQVESNTTSFCGNSSFRAAVSAVSRLYNKETQWAAVDGQFGDCGTRVVQLLSAVLESGSSGRSLLKHGLLGDIVDVLIDLRRDRRPDLVLDQTSRKLEHSLRAFLSAAFVVTWPRQHVVPPLRNLRICM